MSTARTLAHTVTAAAGALAGSFAVAPVALAAGGQPPAGGAAIGQVIGATAGATLATLVLLWVISAHRSGRIKFLARGGALAERLTGLPAWSSVPAAVLGATLLIAVYGMYWDISIHIDKGRDPGPLANAAHYFILVGLFGVFVCGALSVALAKRKPSNVAFTLSRSWHVPLGAALILLCSAVSLLAFPLDDMWHRLFGQDVTLWGPTHLLLFGGASFSLIGLWVLQVEGSPGGRLAQHNPMQRFRDLSLAGGLLIGMSTFQGEFDFGVPQFRLTWHPVLLALAAGIALVSARIRLGRGGALAAVGFFVLVRGGLALIVGGILGHTTPHFPLYIVEALCVEGAALAIPRNRPITFGAISGLLIGTVGFAGEYAWSHVWMVNPWPASFLGEAIPCAILAGLAGGVLGGFIGRSLTPESAGERAPRWAVPAAAVAVIGLAAWLIPMPLPSNPPKATVALTDVTPAPHRTVQALVKLDPPDAAKDARWLNVTAWQGGGSVVDQLKKVGPGTYRTTKPIPVWGQKWKATLRLHRGDEVLGVPIYLPPDQAIPVPGVPAPRQFTRTFEKDKKLLQREQKPGVSSFLTTLAYIVVLLVGLTVLGLIGYGLTRIAREIGTAPRSRDQRRSVSSGRVAAPAS